MRDFFVNEHTAKKPWRKQIYGNNDCIFRLRFPLEFTILNNACVELLVLALPFDSALIGASTRFQPRLPVHSAHTPEWRLFGRHVAQAGLKHTVLLRLACDSDPRFHASYCLASSFIASHFAFVTVSHWFASLSLSKIFRPKYLAFRRVLGMWTQVSCL